MPNPDPPLTLTHLASIVRECGYMAKSKDWKERLLYRLAKAHLDTLTQQAIAAGVAKEPGFAERVKQKRK